MHFIRTEIVKYETYYEVDSYNIWTERNYVANLLKIEIKIKGLHVGFFFVFLTVLYCGKGMKKKTEKKQRNYFAFLSQKRAWDGTI